MGKLGRERQFREGKDLEQMPEIGKPGVKSVWGIMFKSRWLEHWAPEGSNGIRIEEVSSYQSVRFVLLCCS